MASLKVLLFLVGFVACTYAAPGEIEINQPIEGKEEISDQLPVQSESEPLPREPYVNTTRTAFSVARTSPLGPVTEDTIITYDHINANFGNGFKPFNSYFNAPVAGLYYFSTQIRGNSKASVEIKHNGVGLVRAIAAEGGAASTSVAVVMERGDSVYCVLKNTWDAWIHSTPDKFVTFSGFLIAYLE